MANRQRLELSEFRSAVVPGTPYLICFLFFSFETGLSRGSMQPAILRAGFAAQPALTIRFALDFQRRMGRMAGQGPTRWLVEKG